MLFINNLVRGAQPRRAKDARSRCLPGFNDASGEGLRGQLESTVTAHLGMSADEDIKDWADRTKGWKKKCNLENLYFEFFV